MRIVEKIYRISGDWARRQTKHGNPPSLEQYFEERSETPNIDYLKQNLATLDSNIASLLTHVSAMIAATGVLLIVFDDQKITQAFILAEMLGYCLATILLILNLPYHRHAPHKLTNKRTLLEAYYGSYLTRRHLYVTSAHLVLALTICFAVTVFAHLLFVFIL